MADRDSDMGPIKRVFISSPAVLRVVKHCQSVSAIGESAQGRLLGYREDDETVRISHCFAMPQLIGADEEERPSDDKRNRFLTDMTAVVDQQNYDQLIVGWYLTSYFGAHINLNLFDAQLDHQRLLDEAIVLVYDPVRSSQGQLALKAFRLGTRLLEMVRDRGTEFGISHLKQYRGSFVDLFEELPVHATTSNLMNVLLCELEWLSPTRNYRPVLSLRTGPMQEKHLSQLVDSVDRLQYENGRLAGIHDQVRKLQMQRNKSIQRTNEERKLEGLPPLTDEQIKQQYQPLHDPPRLKQLVHAAHAKQCVERVKQYSAQNLSKMHMVDALQGRLEEASSTFLTQLHREINPSDAM